MRTGKLRSGFLASAWKWLLLAAAAAAVLWYLTAALDRVDDAQSGEGRRILTDSLRSAAVSNYVSRGVYPATLEELTERYGITVDEDRYAVYYEVFADNIMPEITVVALQTEGGNAG